MSELDEIRRGKEGMASGIQEMEGAYANDVGQGRAEAMEALARKGRAIAQPIIDRFPPDYGDKP